MARWVIQEDNGKVFVIEETLNGNPETLVEGEFWQLVEYLQTNEILGEFTTKTFYHTPDRVVIEEPEA